MESVNQVQQRTVESHAQTKQDLAGPSGASVFMTLKAERDALRRAIKTGQIWTPDEPV